MDGSAEFKHISVSGSPYERGLQHGKQLGEEIREVYDFYETQVFGLSNLSTVQIQGLAARIRASILAYSPALATEIDAIAEGSGMEPWQIYALNGRSEILNTEVGECTSVSFQESCLLGQTWDWVEPLEEWAVLITHEYPDGHRVLTFGEPGMVGKVGLNNRGVGVCLNFLFARINTQGVPIHIVARSILDSTTLEDAKAAVYRSGLGKAGHLLLADDLGEYCSVEFAGDSHYEVQSLNNALVHTNHFIAAECNESDSSITGTYERLTQARKWLEEIDRQDLDAMKAILLDNSAGICSINAPYHSDVQLNGLKVGTVAVLIMDLPNRVMHIKRGNSAADNFKEISL